MDRIKLNTASTAIPVGRVTFKRDIAVAWLTIFPAAVVGEGKMKQTYAMVAKDDIKLTVSDPELIKQLKAVAGLGDVGMSSGKRPFIKGKCPLTLTGVVTEGVFIRSVETIDVAEFTPAVDPELDAELSAYIKTHKK